MLKPELIGKISSISSVLEVSGYPKPGNVHRTRDFFDMSFEDFLISGVVTQNIITSSATQAKEILKDNDYSKAHIGKYILEAVKETDNWIKNNTNLGIMMLEVPIAQAASISNDFTEIQENIGKLLDATTVEDAVNLYDAINLASAGGMGEQEEYDVQSDNAKDELRKNNQTMYDVLEISAGWDQLAFELTNKMPKIFDIGFKTFDELRKDKRTNTATVQTFLTLLSKVPDTLISRKYGEEEASKVSESAKTLLNEYGEEYFDKDLNYFDDYLYENNYNPGTTADLTAASIMLSYLKDEME
ncbi:MAG: triphosphoribosyl-dephospho-CoA synthase [Methanobacteriaceae archaeon]|jgi:triphosphoribosyl-dephospho-CoA synthase|uniref:triphosphoribosyl-dephospho-CoA synthase n=1 Tax=unclassified Methanobrevibacter TaxID=2638681 RepID=UPI002A0CB44F|nr:triphosphoribosyl-dephospho-CoA synthase [Methanobacteriaceae archaeon]MDD3408580.1 triphosphoribosyl-dephospho-CoA synthase [Methanobacteriaceae archaeon]MDD4594433.1 triphosphoribosyl-dephospho-CoA synthase [Methanobacteriaceae archaeon]